MNRCPPQPLHHMCHTCRRRRVGRGTTVSCVACSLATINAVWWCAQCNAESCKETNSTAEYGSHIPATTAGTGSRVHDQQGCHAKAGCYCLTYLQQASLWHEAQGGKCPQGVGQVLTVAGVKGSHSQAGCIRQQVSGWAPGQLGKGPQGECQVLLVELVQDAVHVAGSSCKDLITCRSCNPCYTAVRTTV